MSKENVLFSGILEKYGLEKLSDAVTEIVPKGYITDNVRLKISEVSKYPDKTNVTIYGYINSFVSKDFGKKGLKRVSAKLFYNGESITLFWIINKSKERALIYSLSQTAAPDVFVQVSGKVSSFESGQKRVVMIASPKLSRAEVSTTSSSDPGKITVEPMYVLRKKTTVHQIQNLFRHILNDFDNFSFRFMPKELEKRIEAQDLKKSLLYLHGFKPIPLEKLESFLNYKGFFDRINLEKIWETIYSSHKNNTETNMPSIMYTKEELLEMKNLISKIPFVLTEDQMLAVRGLIELFRKSTKTRSLVYGDVGSGKTVVAILVSAMMHLKGMQIAIIAPSSILAKQHYEEAKKLFPDMNVFLVHSKTKISEKRKIQKHLLSGESAIVFGTTSVNSLEFKNLFCVFIDEEQKFGVAAKEKLYEKYGTHLIFMTATPIPRTLASSIFMNFSVFKVAQKPSHQKPRVTKIIKDFDRKQVGFISKKIFEGREQALVVVPSIDSDDLVNIENAENKYKKYFPDAVIQSIHGKMKKEEVDKTIEDFMGGGFDILISTTMVDAGFSNKNLSFVFIENPDRFGIAQLHQIRGRCGRGSKKGFCFLMAGDRIGKKSYARLNTLCESEDGFYLSEMDLKMRGSGDISKSVQSGMDLNFMFYKEEIEEMKKYLSGK